MLTNKYVGTIFSGINNWRVGLIFFSNFKIVKIKISERISWHFIVIIKLFQFNKQCVTHSKCVWKILMIIMYFNLEVYKVLYTGYKVSKLFLIIIDNFHILLRFYGTKSSKYLTNITKRTHLTSTFSRWRYRYFKQCITKIPIKSLNYVL